MSHLTNPRASVIYECPECEPRYLGERRCPDCQLFTRRVPQAGPVHTATSPSPKPT